MLIKPYGYSSGVTGTWTANNATLSAYDQYLTAYWKAEDTSDSVGSNTLTNNGSVTFPSAKHNNGFGLNGSSQYMSIADNADVSPTTSVAIPVWVYFNVNPSGNRSIMAKSSTLDCYYQNGSDQMVFQIRQSNSTFATLNTGVTPPITTFTHYVFIADATAGKIYLYQNGSEIGTAVSYDGTLGDNANALNIGADGGVSVYFPGILDEIPFYKNPVFANDTAREAFVTAHYNGGTGSFYIG